MNPILTCVQFASDGVTCTQTAWVQQFSFWSSFTASQGALVGGTIMGACVAIWASKLIRFGA